jgi:hypothetical protein
MALDFLQPYLDSRITFTRGSNATLVDSTGKITYAPANLFLRSEEFDNAAWVKQGNGVATAPTVTANSGVAPDGTSTADRVQLSLNGGTATGDISLIYQSVTLTSVPAIFSVYLKSNTASSFNMQITNPDGSSTAITVTPEWQRFNGISASAAGTTNYQIRLRGGQSPVNPNTADVLMWGAQLEPVTYQTTPSTYVATTTAAYYGPRFDYDPVTLAPRGLLIEEQRTNLLLYSEQLDNAIWSLQRATITANATASPDGTVTADRLVDNAVSGTHRVFQTVVKATSALAYTGSVYLKAGTLGFATIRLSGTGEITNAAVGINLSTGELSAVATGGFTAASASVSNAGNGWWRVQLVGTTDITASINLFIGTATSLTTASSYVGDGNGSIFVWGAQLEQASFATSYIPTVASQVTRSADVASMTGTNFSSWYNQSEGSFVVNVNTFGSGSNRFALGVSDGFNSERIVMFATTASAFRYIVTDGNVAQADITLGGMNVNVVNKIACAYQANSFNSALNGTLGSEDTAGTLPTPNKLFIGLDATGSSPINGHIRSIAYYNTRLPNATLVSLTA